MHNKKTLVIAMVFMTMVYLAEIISNGNATAQTAAVMLSELVIAWNAMKVICCSHRQGDKSSCSKRQSSESL